MSRQQSSHARGAGQRINDRANWKAWRCLECGSDGREMGVRAARAAFEAHWIARHQEVPF